VLRTVSIGKAILHACGISAVYKQGGHSSGKPGKVREKSRKIAKIREKSGKMNYYNYSVAAIIVQTIIGEYRRPQSAHF